MSLSNVNGGLKYDEGKVPLDLLDFPVMEEVAKVLQFGAKKYAAHNWRRGINYSRVFSAALRHLFAWARGERYDAETGISHLAHAMCCLMFLLSFELDGRKELDDRYVKDEESNSKKPIAEQGGSTQYTPSSGSKEEALAERARSFGRSLLEESFRRHPISEQRWNLGGTP